VAGIRDLTAKKEAERERAEDKAFVDAVIEHLPVMLFVKDATTRRYRMLNRVGEDLTGMSREEVIGRSDVELNLPLASDYTARDTAVLGSGKSDVYESTYERAPGDARLLRTRRVAMPGRSGAAAYLIGITEDVTERREAQKRVAYLAHHDTLTGLANRARFAELLTEELPGEPAVLCIDLDRFKAINDLFGHETGDRLLQTVAEKLTELVGDGCKIGRLGGDEFAIVVPGPDAARAAEHVARLIVERLGEPSLVDGRFTHIGASVGIAVAGVDATDTPALLRSADLALYRAKGQGRGQYCFFEAEMDLAAKERRALEADLRVALRRGEIALHYQPLACLETGRVSGFEALARWQHPQRGAISPEVFIPIAEECGLIAELGSYILRRATREAAGWSPPLRVAVNLSPLQFTHGDLAGEVETILHEANLDPRRLELEITEGLLIRDADRALAILGRLKQLGIRIAMDDFGTGYSSLSYFRQFPFDKVKIDQSFVREMSTNRQALAVVQAVIGLGRGLGMPIVAEGVESEAQLEGLRAEGCTEVQGFFIGRPQPIENFEAIVIDRQRRPGGAGCERQVG
jgi:diguanylate cyclase (GGDEF)-like protein/PAS domain S-box-containing protein